MSTTWTTSAIKRVLPTALTIAAGCATMFYTRVAAAQPDPGNPSPPSETALPTTPPTPTATPRPAHPPSDPDADEKNRPPPDKTILHGFRFGYGNIANFDDNNPNSPKEKYHLKSPHQFIIGYELMARLVGHSWLNVILVGNVLVTGLEQSRVLPNANTLIGFEFNKSFQAGVGANLTPDPDKPAHMILAGGWTPRAGSFYVPVHVFFIPDVDGYHRSGVTVGVNW
jgi:hypothetical protein